MSQGIHSIPGEVLLLFLPMRGYEGFEDLLLPAGRPVISPHEGL
ncbi:Uncharacterized protein dnm_042710 [Desulfonema magnum]|uniref:Uncharacterized protein n=1 Tax=Desulfonema magnum TaxID=45655 RepID=A0A975GNX4_9BACT|nr:Uncharacterized protein dnm_042710 [Desulfonema magnum]